MRLRRLSAAEARRDLRRADRRWLRRTASAPLFLLFGLGLWNSRTLWDLQDSGPASIAVWVLVLSAPVWCWLGIWRLGAAEPAAPPAFERGERVPSCASLPSRRITFFAAHLARSHFGGTPRWLFYDFSAPLSILSVVPVHFRFAQLARRAGRTRLARQHEWLAILAPVITSGFPLLIPGRQSLAATGSSPGMLAGVGRDFRVGPDTQRLAYYAGGNVVFIEGAVWGLSVIASAWLVVLVMISAGWLLSAAYRRR